MSNFNVDEFDSFVTGDISDRQKSELLFQKLNLLGKDDLDTIITLIYGIENNNPIYLRVGKSVIKDTT